VDEERGVVESPGKEEDLGGGTLFFGGADDGGYGFEVVLREMLGDWELLKEGETYGDDTNNSIAVFFCFSEHSYGSVVFH
jgi:hypothetical protein